MEAHDEHELDKEADEAHNDEAQSGLQADLVELCRENQKVYSISQNHISYDPAIAYIC